MAASMLLGVTLLFSGCSEEKPIPKPQPPPPVRTIPKKPAPSEPGPYYSVLTGSPSSKKNSSPSTRAPAKDSPRKSVPSNFNGAMGALHEAGLGAVAEELERRVSQKKRKMKLSEADARAIASYVVKYLPEMPNARKLLDIMPRSTVELIAGVGERGVSKTEAEKIAEFHLKFTKNAGFRNLSQFDENHSHVIGRDWPDIDYSGERMTWQGQKKSWSRHGVEDFKTAASVCNYFRETRKARYHKRIYKPRRTTFPRELNSYCD